MNDTPSILVVDDEISNRAIAIGILAASGWDAHGAEDGNSAVAAVQDGSYALVLMDIQMPGLDGFDATRAIRASGGRDASVPILAFTAVPPGDAIERARKAGMDGHIAKPFTPETLLSAVEPWRPRGEPNPAASLAAIFGHAEIAAMLSRFRDQLAEALAADDGLTARQARAHKIAGISGTLGFAEVSRTWLAVSEGDESAWEDARASARRAMRTIDADGDLTAGR
jgi:CheY-like chemotaxis protein